MQKMAKILALGFSLERTHRELSNEHQHNSVWMVFKNLRILVLWTKVASASEGLRTFQAKVVIGIIKLSLNNILMGIQKYYLNRERSDLINEPPVFNRLDRPAMATPLFISYKEPITQDFP